MNQQRSFVFAGGGTGGHIYPGIAIAQQIQQTDPNAKILFFCSQRDIDQQVLEKAGFEHKPLPATGFSLRPAALISFIRGFCNSTRTAKQYLRRLENPVVIGIGGFVTAPVSRAAHKLSIPVVLINTDITPGKANRFAARWAQQVFVQFEETLDAFDKYRCRVEVLGCPLRRQFENPQPENAKTELSLDPEKKILLILGGSSGARSINQTACSLARDMSEFAEDWQIVHIAGHSDYQRIKDFYVDAPIAAKVLEYYDNMADLLAASSLAIGRSGAVSVAEYAAAELPSICMPYPHHKDLHQYRNAGKLVEINAAVIVDDLPDENQRRQWLREELFRLLRDDSLREKMAKNCKKLEPEDAAHRIAKAILNIND